MRLAIAHQHNAESELFDANRAKLYNPRRRRFAKDFQSGNLADTNHGITHRSAIFDFHVPVSIADQDKDEDVKFSWEKIRKNTRISDFEYCFFR